LRNYRAKNHRFHARLFINALDSLGRLINRKKRGKKKDWNWSHIVSVV